MKKSVLFFSLYFVCCLLAASLEASFFDDIKNTFTGNNLPLPPDTTEVRQMQEVKIGDIAPKSTVYESSLSAEEVLSFFKTQLPRYGWKEIDYQKKMAQLLQIDPNASLRAAQGMGVSPQSLQNLIGNTSVYKIIYFTNEQNETLILSFLPVGFQSPGGKKTRFYLNRATSPGLQKSNKTLQEFFPEQPQKLPFMPLYPRAQQVYLMKSSANRITVGYITTDDIDSVARFYVERMPENGWRYSTLSADLDKKMNLDEVKRQVAQQKEKSQDCPNCPGKEITPQSLEQVANFIENMRMKNIVFVKGNNESCTISINENKFGVGGGSASTIITVLYTKK